MPQPQGFIAALDGGQTGTRASLATPDGSIVGEGRAGPANCNHMFDAEARREQALESALLGAFRSAGQHRPRLISMTVALSGVGPNSRAIGPLEKVIQALSPVHHLSIVPDYAAALAAVGEGPAVVVLSGGGAVAYGRGPSGNEALAGGGGYLVGDEGSGFDIGRKAVAAALRFADGRSEPTILLDEVLAHFKLESMGAVLGAIYSTGLDKATVAALAPVVAAAASAGDSIALDIIQTSANELALAAFAVINRLFPQKSAANVYLMGGIAAMGEVLTLPFAHALTKSWPNALPHTSSRSPLDGALVIAFRNAGLVPTSQLRSRTT